MQLRKRWAAAAIMIGAMNMVSSAAWPAPLVPPGHERGAMLKMAGETAPCVPTFIYYEDGTFIIIFCHPAHPPKLPFN